MEKSLERNIPLVSSSLTTPTFEFENCFFGYSINVYHSVNTKLLFRDFSRKYFDSFECFGKARSDAEFEPGDIISIKNDGIENIFLYSSLATIFFNEYSSNGRNLLPGYGSSLLVEPRTETEKKINFFYHLFDMFENDPTVFDIKAVWKDYHIDANKDYILQKVSPFIGSIEIKAARDSPIFDYLRTFIKEHK